LLRCLYNKVVYKKEALAASKGEKTPPDLKESFNGGPVIVPEDIKYELLYNLERYAHYSTYILWYAGSRPIL
jgi:hypothetical protein